MGAIDFDAWYRRYMPAGNFGYGGVREIANIIAGGVAVSGSAGMEISHLFAQFAKMGVNVGDLEAIVAGLEQAGRVHRRCGRVFAGFPVPPRGH